MKIHPEHFTKIGYCRRGSRRFFQRHRLDWSTFLKHGIEADVLRATRDAMAVRLVEFVEEAHG